MIDLIKFELKKIFSNKLIYIVMAAIFTVTLFSLYQDYKNINDYFGSKEEYLSTAEKFKSGRISSKQMQNIFETAQAKRLNEEKLSKDENFILNYAQTVSTTDGSRKVSIEGMTYTYDQVKNHINELKNSNKENTFEYNDFVKAESMMAKLNKPHNLYLGDWSKLFGNAAAVMKIILLVLGVASIYSKEYTTRVLYLNLSSKKGRTSLNTAKIVASLIYTVIIFAFITIMNRISAMILGLPNGNEAMNSFGEYNIFNMSINQYYVSSLLMSLLGMICFTLLIVLLSLATKNIIISFGLPLALYTLPEMMKLPQNIMQYTAAINFTELLRGFKLFSGYLSFNVFGKVAIYPYVAIIFAVVSLTIMMILFHVISRRQFIA